MPSRPFIGARVETPISVRIDGVEELFAQLADLNDELRTSVGRAGLEAAALPIQNRWKQLAPVLTGTYRKSIHTEIIQENYNRQVAEIGTNITDPPYPFFLEYGTSKMAARPSMRPAFDEKQDEAVQEMVDVINECLVRYGGK